MSGPPRCVDRRLYEAPLVDSGRRRADCVGGGMVLPGETRITLYEELGFPVSAWT